MPKCPGCQGRLPLTQVLQGHVVICPGCSNELEPKRWTTLVPLLAALLVIIQGPNVLKAAGWGRVTALLAALAVGFILWLLLYLWMVRYRLKNDLSILAYRPTPPQ